MKSISILGSTGSIGTQTLDIVRLFPDQFNVVGLCAGNNIDLFKTQLLEFTPQFASIQSETHYNDLKTFISDNHLNTQLFYGHEGLSAIATVKQDLVIISLAGTIGIKPTFDAIQAGNHIGLACKEVLVSAGKLVMETLKKHKVSMLPIDSEHAALKQCLDHPHSFQDIKKMTITASGGPFWDLPLAEFSSITLQRALNHPNWSMGKKISIDSSTFVNKGLEVIEAHHLFDIPFNNIDVVVHRQSVVHGMVEFIDGNTLAHLSSVDMRVPIQYCLFYPEKKPFNESSLSLTQLKQLDFFEPNHRRFPLLNLAYDVGKKGGSYPVVFNAANEAAVHLFLAEKINYLDIHKFIVHALETFNHTTHLSIESIIQIDQAIKDQIIHDYSH